MGDMETIMTVSAYRLTWLIELRNDDKGNKEIESCESGITAEGENLRGVWVEWRKGLEPVRETRGCASELDGGSPSPLETREEELWILCREL
jgi:hypothetical protein